MNQKVRKVSVIGLGTLGTQIAIQAAYYGNEVRPYDQDSEIFQNMCRRLAGTLLI